MLLQRACAAARLAEALTDGELIVLLASQGIRKRGATHRVFAARDLQKASVTDPLRASGQELSECLHALVQKGMLARRGRDGFTATTAGNLVKHSFNELDRSLRIRPLADNFHHRSPERILLLRECMIGLCLEREGRDPRSALTGAH